MTDPTPDKCPKCHGTEWVDPEFGCSRCGRGINHLPELLEHIALVLQPPGNTDSAGLVAAAALIRALTAERDALTLSRLREYDLRLEITEAERDDLKAENERLIRLTTGIDSVRSAWHATESPVWTSRVIESLRHSGLMEADDD